MWQSSYLLQKGRKPSAETFFSVLSLATREIIYVVPACLFGAFSSCFKLAVMVPLTVMVSRAYLFSHLILFFSAALVRLAGQSQRQFGADDLWRESIREAAVSFNQ